MRSLGPNDSCRAAKKPGPSRWIARVVAALGLIIPWGVFAYTGFITITAGEGAAPVAAVRPAGWLLLQLLAAAILLAAMMLGFSWFQKRDIRRGLILVGVILFIPWAIWWQLLSL